MKATASILEPKLLRQKAVVQKQGTVVIGTVKDDVHGIGKSIIATMLMAAGFNVIGLAVYVPNSKFAEAIEEYEPDILALSALMTTTVSMQEEIIKYLKALGVRERSKILVGGGVVTKESADKMDADGHAADAVEAVVVAKKLSPSLCLEKMLVMEVDNGKHLGHFGVGSIADQYILKIFDIRIFWMKAKEIAKEYDIVFDPKAIVPTDATLIDDAWRAGMDLATRSGYTLHRRQTHHQVRRGRIEERSQKSAR